MSQINAEIRNGGRKYAPNISEDHPVVIQVEQFSAWKSRLLRRLKSVDLVTKIALSLPLLMPAFLLWSLNFWASKIKIAMLTDTGSYLMIFLYILVLPYYYYWTGLAKLSKQHRKRRLIKIDWSKPKYQELANAITNSGINIAKITGELAVDDSWNIHIYPQPRQFLFLSKRMKLPFLLFNGLLLAITIYLGAPEIWALFGFFECVVLLIILGVVITLDLFRPRLVLVITTRVLTLLKGEPDKFTLVLSHELSHIRHRDPVARVIWQQREETGAFLLFWGAIFFILMALVTKNTVSAWVFISCVFGWFIALLLISDLVPLLQELRSDLEAINSTAERELLIQVLRVIPIESRHQSYLNRSISFRQMFSVIKDAGHLFRINDQKEVMRQRIAMLESGEIPLTVRRLPLKLLVYFLISTATLITSQVFLSRLVIPK